MREHGAFYKEVGQRIRDQRMARKVSQEALAMAVDLKRTSISNIEKGRQKLLLHTFYEIADALGTNPAALLPQRLKQEPLQAATARTLQTLSPEEREFVIVAADLRQSSVTKGKRKR